MLDQSGQSLPVTLPVTSIKRAGPGHDRIFFSIRSLIDSKLTQQLIVSFSDVKFSSFNSFYEEDLQTALRGNTPNICFTDLTVNSGSLILGYFA